MIAAALLLGSQAVVPAGPVETLRFAAATADEVWSQFARLCLNGPRSKTAFVNAVETSSWGFHRAPLPGEHPDRQAVDGRWLAPKGLLVAYHGEPNLKVSLPYQCTLHVSPAVGSDPDALERAGSQVVARPPDFRFVVPVRTQFGWTDYAFDGDFTRRISLAHMLKNTPQQSLQLSVVYETRKIP